jgi:hypothetical protein
MNDHPLPLSPKQKDRLLEIAKRRIASLEDEVQKRTEERDTARAWIQTLQERQCVLTCAFCGYAYPPGTPSSNVETLTKHVAVCPEHPMAKDRARLDRLAIAVQRFRNVEMLGPMIRLRRTEEYKALCAAWEEATGVADGTAPCADSP